MLRVEICINARIDESWSEWLAGLDLSYTASGETILSGEVQDQAELYGLLSSLRDLGLPLVSVRSAEVKPQA